MVMQNRKDVCDGVEALCKHLFQSSDGNEIGPHFPQALKILGSSAFNSDGAKAEEFQVIEKIRKRLSRNANKPGASVRFEELCNKLRSVKSVQHRPELLQFLCALDLQHPREKSVSLSNGTRKSVVVSGSKGPATVPKSKSVSVYSNSTVSHQHGSPLLTGKNSNSSELLLMSEKRSWTTSSGFGSGVGTNMEEPSSSTIKNASTTTTTTLRSSNLSQSRQSPAETRISARYAYDPSLARVSEAELLSDVIFVLQGLDGRHVRLTPKKDAFVFDATTNISSSMKEQLLSILECGWLFVKVKAFCDERLALTGRGLIAQAFSAALCNELTEYYRLLSVLQVELNQSDDAGHGKLTLHRVQAWMWQLKKRVALLSSLVDGCQNLKGGALVSHLIKASRNADPDSARTVNHILSSVCRPLQNLLVSWITDGTLDDSFEEFFISCNANAAEEKLWTDKYALRHSMIPSFFSTEQVTQILLAGKSINFLQLICKERGPIGELDVHRTKFRDMPSEWLHLDSLSYHFQTLLDEATKAISRHLLAVLREKFILKTHFQALKKYMLMSQGDFGRILMELLQEALDQPADAVYLHHLTGHLAMAIRQSNAIYEPQDVVDRLDVELLEKAGGECGWDIFMLKYWVKGPISTIFNDGVMKLYSRMFDFIWRMKRLDFVLSKVWLHLMSDARQVAALIPEMRPIVHTFHLMTSEVMHFVEQMQYYFTFEIMECAWAELEKRLDGAGDLDQVLRAHQDYIEKCVRQSLLSEEEEPLRNQLRTIMDLVFSVVTLHSKFAENTQGEVDARREWNEKQKKRTKKGQWAVSTDQEQNDEDERRRATVECLVRDFRSPLGCLQDQYRLALQQFLMSLTAHDDDQLRCLCFRLDYSQFYRQREPRLEASLRYSRLSKRYSAKTLPKQMDL